MSRKSGSNHFWAYGVRIASEIPLRDLLPSEDKTADVHIRYEKLTDDKVSERLTAFKTFGRAGCRVLVSENAMYVDWDRVGRFFVNSGSEVLVDPEATVLEEDLEPFLTGPILAILLHQRGYFVLHSSAVMIDGAAAVFLGSKGDGKSTLAAHLQVRGHQLISDDLVPVILDGPRADTYPGFPRIKLYEDSIRAVGEHPERFPLIHRFVEKRSFRYSEEFPKTPIEIRGVYVLSESTDVHLEPLNRSLAFIELTKHSFLNSFLAAMNSQRDHFRQCEQMVRSVPIMKLGRPHDFSAMDRVCSILEDHAAGGVAADVNQVAAPSPTIS